MTPSQAEAAPSEDNNREYGEEDDENAEEDRAAIPDPDRRRTAAGINAPAVFRPRPVRRSCAPSTNGLPPSDADPGTGDPVVLMGRDVLGTAQTGTGKTAGFTLPMLDILSGSRARARMPRSLILEPTRELALQVAENFVEYGKYLKLTHALIIGGESMSDQKDVLNRGVDVLIATPGRLLDMFDRGRHPADRHQAAGHRRSRPHAGHGLHPRCRAHRRDCCRRTRQTLFFSATMGPEIRRLGDAFLQNPKEIAVSRAASVATTITEGLALVAEHDKREALRRLIRSENVQNALIFCNRKRDVDILHKSLTKHHFDARGAARGHGADRAVLDIGEVQGRRTASAGVQRRGGTRPRHRRPVARIQLRCAESMPRTTSIASAAPVARGWRARPLPSPRRMTDTPWSRSRN